MDRKNITDFVGPDVLERLEALEREEEKVEAEGFHDMESEMVWSFIVTSDARARTDHVRFRYDSEDEREAVVAKAAREKKLISQCTKKAMKNRAALPRTACLRTLSELTTEMTKAGLDPTRIQERQREEQEAQMDVDEDADMGEEGEEEWMDVDGEAPQSKKAKTNSGPVVVKGARHP